MTLRGPAFLLAVALAAAVPAPGMPARAQGAGEAPPESDPLRETEDAIVRALTRTLDLLSRTFDRVMIYETPELLPNGDILIRRKREPPPEPPPAPSGDAERVPL